MFHPPSTFQKKPYIPSMSKGRRLFVIQLRILELSVTSVCSHSVFGEFFDKGRYGARSYLLASRRKYQSWHYGPKKIKDEWLIKSSLRA